MHSLKRYLLLPAANLLVGLGLVPTVWSQQALLTQPVKNDARVVLRGTVHPLANPRNDRGAASADMQLDRLQLVLKRSPQQESALRQRIQDMHTPGSASYHQWLTPEQFGEQFGANDQDIQTIQSWVESQGMQVLKVNPGKGTLEVAGTVGALQKAFHTSIHKYSVNGQTHFANSTNPEIPAALAPVLGGFVSLNNFHLKHYSRYLGNATYNAKTHQTTPQWTLPGGSLGNVYAVAPEDFATQYDVTPLYTASKPLNGSGQTIAIINESNINANFVNNFRTLFGLPASPPQVIIDGNDPGIDGDNNPDGSNGASAEAYLDVEWSGAVAPGATIDLVIAADTSLEQGLYLAAERAIYSNLAPVMSVSFGECETALGPDNSFVQGLWEQAAAQGITVMVSTGDSGSAGCDNPDTETVATKGLAVNGFASTPFNVAVGGTDFIYPNQGAVATYWNATNDSSQGSLKNPIPEQVWNDSQFGTNLLVSTSGSISGGSGGPSTCGNPTLDSTNTTVLSCAPTAKPAWQVATGVPADSARDIPDVSLFAANGANASFYAVCAADGDCQPGGSSVQISAFGGTSVASPAFAGIMAIVNQKYGPQGQADYELYPLSAKTPTAFRDVTSGTNQMPCAAGSPNCTNGELTGYAAGPGYDLGTGLGTIDANVMVTNWNSRSNGTASTTTLTLSSTSFAHGTAINFKTSVTGSGGTPTGDVVVLTDSPLPNLTGLGFLTLTNGSASDTGETTFPGGTYNVWGQYSGDTTFAPSTSTKTQITVTPEPSTLYLQAKGNLNGQFSDLTGQQVPYGTPAYLNGYPVPTSYYNCTSNNCPAYTFATGTVSFTDNGNALNTVVVNAEGDAEYTTGTLAVGNHSIAGTYSGDASYNKGTSQPATVAFTVVKGNTSVQLSSPLSTITAGTPLIITALVNTAGGGTAPTGTVTFMAGTTNLGTANVSSIGNSFATATYTITSAQSSALSGTVDLTANYSGDTNYNAGSTTAPGFVLTIGASAPLTPSTTTATASAMTTSPSAAINVSITVTGKSGGAAPTGTVDLQSAGFDLTPGGIPVTAGTGATATATTSLDSSTLVQGNNSVVVTYAGDTTYAPSGTTLSLSNPRSDFSMVAQTPTVTIAAGATGTATVGLGSINGFNASVGLACTAPTGMTCSLNPTSVTVNGNTTATVSIVAATTSTSAIKASAWWVASGGATLACVFFFGLPASRRRWGALTSLMLLVFLAAGMGCGGGGGGNSGGGGTGGGGGGTGGGGGGGGGGSTTTPTAVGTYTVVVTGTQGTAISHSAAVSVVVTAAQ